MPRPSFHPRRPHPSRRATRIAASQELQAIVHANKPDWYPNPPDSEDDPRKVVPFMALEWQYVSVFLVTIERAVLLLRLDDMCAKDPKVWTAPFGRHSRTADVRRNAARTLYADTGIDFPHERLEIINECMVSRANFGGNTTHAFVVAEWTEADGPLPAIAPPVGAVECQFFTVAELPIMSVPYARNLIEARLRR